LLFFCFIKEIIVFYQNKIILDFKKLLTRALHKSAHGRGPPVVKSDHPPCSLMCCRILFQLLWRMSSTNKWFVVGRPFLFFFLFLSLSSLKNCWSVFVDILVFMIWSFFFIFYFCPWLFNKSFISFQFSPSILICNKLCFSIWSFFYFLFTYLTLLYIYIFSISTSNPSLFCVIVFNLILNFFLFC
jgi:hypothetical protein